MDTKLLVEQYLANGGTITKLPDGEAEGALRLDAKDVITNSQLSLSEDQYDEANEGA
jgi:hypothetical protein